MEHQSYPQVTQQNAQVTSWTFSNNQSEGSLYYYKFPQLGSHQVRIKVKYTGLSRSDTFAFGNSNNGLVVPGSQIVGQVASVGTEVCRFSIGDRVGAGLIRGNCGNCAECHRGWEHLCRNFGSEKYTSGLRFGGYSNYVDINANWVFHIPSSIPLERVAPLLSDGVSVYSALKKYTNQKTKLVIVGYNSLGNLALRISKAFGVKNISVVGTSDQEQVIKSEGAEFINITQFNQVYKFSLVLICLPHLGSNDFQNSLVSTKRNGKIVVIGSPSLQKIDINFFSLVVDQKQIIGNLTGSRQDHYQILRLAAKHKIQPQVELIGFGQINTSFRRVLNGQQKIHIVAKI